MKIITLDENKFPLLIKTKNKFIKAEIENHELRLTDMTCMHRGGPLTHGISINGRISCPWHGKKAMACKLKTIDMPSVVNNGKVMIVVQGFEKTLKLPENKEIDYVSN